MVLVDTGVNSSYLFWRFNLIDLKKIKRFAQEIHDKNNDGHGFDHIERVVALAQKILLTEPSVTIFSKSAAGNSVSGNVHMSANKPFDGRFSK